MSESKEIFEACPECGREPAQWYQGVADTLNCVSPELARLKAQLEVATKALEHYADRNRWDTTVAGRACYYRSVYNGYDIAGESLKQIADLGKRDNANI